MPKAAASSLKKVRAYVSEFPTEFQATPRGELHCKICSSIVQHDRRCNVLKHRAAAKHQKQLSLNKPIQSLLKYSSPQEEYVCRVTKTFLSADIALNKLNNPELKSLFEYMGRIAPSESSCRARVASLADMELNSIIESLEGKQIFMIVDESEVAHMKCINTLVGDIQSPAQVYLVSCKVWHGALNRQGIVQVVDDVIKTLKADRENFVLLLSDAARYMIAAGSLLQQLYPLLSHVTCIAHLLHNCAERVRNSFPSIDALVAAVKAATVRNKDRNELFAEIGYPPLPVITRWATWLNAAFYYADNLPAVKAIVDSFNGDGLLVSRAKAAVAEPSLPADLLAVRRDYFELVNMLEKCEAATYTITAAHRDLGALSFGEDSCGVQKYLDKRIEGNPSFLDIVELRRSEIAPALYGRLQQCQPTSVAVERSFSILKKMLAIDRNFKEENIEKYLIMLFNSRK